jgi:small subunit ribosomal protein S6
MQMTEYETTLVVRPDIGGDAVELLLDKVREIIKGGSGKLLAINHWGKKKLAYEIEKQARGIYVHTHYLGKNTLVSELERNLRISDQVLRFLTIRLADQVDMAEREEKAYERPEYDAIDSEADELEAQDGDGDDDDSGYGRERSRDRDRDRDRGDRDDAPRDSAPRDSTSRDSAPRQPRESL